MLWRNCRAGPPGDPAAAGLLSTPQTCSTTPPAFGPKGGRLFLDASPMSRPGLRVPSTVYHRADGQVGTRNHWLVIPLVFCENRNVEALRDAFEEELGLRKAETLPAASAPTDRAAQ